ncbi:phosphoribosylformylglycinamidine synthase subunit PurQ [Spirochaeta cellobiosiphila]|uniref:phosphoribosylformylglycinamidine synthase subunit PurQ n=1 Tax=Spirochaeta cellobiosiphila TaxID=504483 RepID=UPI0003FB0F32|nr:phosphoribosylformylglycinamidine synthase subunit PurQ [Spirochaeta cellobiosiphila]
MTVHACIITGYGINSDLELAEAFEMSGAKADRIHINDLIKDSSKIHEYHIIGFPGGFSFGDHIGSGKVFAHLFKKNLKEDLDKFIKAGKLIIGICNGFQVLVKMGVLPNTESDWIPQTSLIHNDSGEFIDKWVRVKFNQNSPCIWTRGLTEMDLPIRHGEGKFIYSDMYIRKLINESNLVALQYINENPNGSEDDIAGITDITGQILGLMPHPEAYRFETNHPLWRRGMVNSDLGIKIIKKGVDFIAKANII